jgi:hypothetical protein
MGADDMMEARLIRAVIHLRIGNCRIDGNPSGYRQFP